MTRLSLPLQTFNAGEWSPRLYGRSDLPRYAGACAEMLNMLPSPQGGSLRRSGTRFVAATKGDLPGILIPFRFSAEQAYVIEATANAFRFYRGRARIESPPGTPYEVATPYGAGDLALLRWSQSADTLFLVHPDHAPRLLQRFGNADWRLSPLDFRDGPYGRLYGGKGQGNGPGVLGIGLGASAINGDGVTITAVPHGLAVAGAADSGAGLVRVKTAAPHKLKTGDPVRIAGVLGAVAANGDWVVTKVSATELDLQGSAFAGSYLGGGVLDARVFAPSDVGRFLRKLDGSGPQYWGHARITAVVNCYTALVNVLEPFSTTTEERNWRLGAFSATTGWPACVTFYEERLFFAATRAQPDTIWGSVTGDFSNFAPTDTASSTTDVVDSDAVTLTVADDEIDAIRWLKGLKVLAGASAAGELTIQASALNEAITPGNAKYTSASRRGAAPIAPVKVGGGLAFIDRTRRRLCEFGYAVEADAFQAADLSTYAEHLAWRGLAGLAYQDAPQGILWMPADDGSLLGLSLMKEEGILGWHQHRLAGKEARVLAAAVIPGASQSELWLMVERDVGGARRRFVEFMEDEFRPKDANDKARCFFVDAGLTYEGAPADVITGLDHLEGETVTVLADGAAHPDCVVAGGQVALDRAAMIVQVGLGFVSRLKSMPLEVAGPGGWSLGGPKRIARVAVRFHETLGARIGAAADGPLEEVLFRPGQGPMDASAPLFSGVKTVAFPAGWERQQAVLVLQEQPLPLHVLAFAPILTATGD